MDAAIEVHRTLGGPGLLESVYEEALAWELGQRGLPVERQKALPIVTKAPPGRPITARSPVAGRVIVEAKAVIQYNPVFAAQCPTYLRPSGLKLGLVINFGEARVADGIHRVVNNL